MAGTPETNSRASASLHRVTRSLTYTAEPVGVVIGGRTEAVEDNWNDVTSTIRIADHLPDDATLGLAEFSHVEVVFVFNRIDAAAVNAAARRPRRNPNHPVVGIFASRG